MQEKRPYRVGYVMVREFLCDREGKAFGITGLRWPDGKEIQVIQEAGDEAGQGQRRPSFERLRTPDYQGRALACGGMLRLRLFADPLNSARFATDWPHVLTYDQSESLHLMRFGHGHVRIFTPQEVSAKRHWFAASPQGKELVEANLAKAHGVNRDEMIEELLAAEFPGRERYRALCYLYNADASLRATPKEADLVRDNLLTFFQLPEMQPVQNQATAYRPVKPYLLVRSLDSANRVSASFAFQPSDAEWVRRDQAGRILEKRFLSPEECLDKVMARVVRCPRFDVLPCMVYPFSMEQMRMGEGSNTYHIRKVAKMNRESHRLDEQGVYRPLVREMGFKLAPGGSFVIVESLYNQSLPACEPELLTRERACYERSPKPKPRSAEKPGEGSAPEEEPSFSMRLGR
ncbi:MAG: hypothetical protein K6G15_00265 [Desulfovibrio sp.]|nr:hypothetical protein [Desulfovibrio sp.]